jgi:pilus assembly protein CpaB
MNNWKGVGLLLFAAVIAVAAGGIAYLYLTGSSSGKGSHVATVPVVVASEDLTFGTRLEEKHLRVAQFPTTAVPQGAYASPDSILKQTTKVFVVNGEPLLASKLSSIGGGLSVRIPESMRATSIDVNVVSGVSGFVLPGDRVDVLCTIDNAPGQQQGVAITKTILQNIEVVAAGVKTTTNKSEPITVQTVTLIVEPKQAEDLTLGMHEGRIHLVLRNPVDSEIVAMRSTDTREVFGLVQPKAAPTRTSSRSQQPQVVYVEKKPEVVPTPSYIIIKDGSIQKQNSPTEGGKGSNP